MTLRHSDGGDRRDRNLIIRIDERVGMLMDDINQVKIHIMECHSFGPRITHLEKVAEDEQQKKYDARLTSIERLFWPVVGATISMFIGIIAVLFKMIGDTP